MGCERDWGLRHTRTKRNTYFMNMQIPVFSIALEMPFHEASIEYFCLAVRGSLGSVAGGGPSPRLGWLLALRSEAANFPNWHPMVAFHFHFHFHLIDISYAHTATFSAISTIEKVISTVITSLALFLFWSLLCLELSVIYYKSLFLLFNIRIHSYCVDAYTVSLYHKILLTHFKCLYASFALSCI